MYTGQSIENGCPPDNGSQVQCSAFFKRYQRLTLQGVANFSALLRIVSELLRRTAVFVVKTTRPVPP
jgi:hypothetical protein